MGFPENRRNAALLTAATATGTSSAVFVPPGKKLFQITQSVSTGSATTKIQASVDGSNWADVYTQTVSAATGNNIFEVDSAVPWWRANVTAVSASPSVSASMAYGTD